MVAIIGIAAMAAALGALLGGRRLAAIVLGMIAGMTLAPRLGPLSAEWFATMTGWNTWVGDALGWMTAYFVVATAIGSLVIHALPRRAQQAGRRRSRFVGASVGGAYGALLGWILFGNFADLVVEHLPSREANSSTAAVRRPFEVIRACRILCGLSAAEVEGLATRPEVDAVFTSDSFDSLLRAPGILQKFSQAADGDWLALVTLAADPTVKQALDEPAFLDCVRSVDIVMLADFVQRRRAGLIAASDGNDMAVHLPQIVADVGFQNRAAVEWFGESDDGEEAEAYWRTVSNVIEVFDRPTGTAWLPRLATPYLPKFEAAR